MARVFTDPRRPPGDDQDNVTRLQRRINYDFQFEEVVADILALIEAGTKMRACRVSLLSRDLKKRGLVLSASSSREAAPVVLSFPLPLINDEIRYTLDVHALDSLQFRSAEAELLDKCTHLLCQAVNKEYPERDHLTGVYNRQGFSRRFEHALEKADRDGQELGIIIFDLDHFKKVNDTYGHPVGDLVLSEFARTIEEAVGDRGVTGRWGGEEFVIALPACGLSAGAKIADEVRVAAAKLTIVADEAAGKSVTLTCSAGVAVFPGHGRDLETILTFADQALYRAKEGGRNRVVVYPLDAPEIQLRKLSEKVTAGGLRGRLDFEDVVEYKSLREEGIVTGIPVAVAIGGSRLYFLDAATNSVRVYDGKTKSEVWQAGGRGDDPDSLEGPADIAVSAGRIYVVDSPNHAVKVYGDGRAFEGFIGGRGADGAPVPGMIKGSFNWPVAIAADNAGRVLVAEHINRRVQRFTADGKFDGLEVPLDGTPTALAYQPDPRDVATDASNQIYVLDAANSAVQKFSEAGVFLATLGTAEPGRFKGFTALALEPTGKLASRLADAGATLVKEPVPLLVIAESGEVNRLQFFDCEGNHIGAVDFGKLEPKWDRRIRPGKMTLSLNGRVYLVDLENADVLVLDIVPAH